MLFAHIERAIVRLEMTMVLCFMVFFKLAGYLDNWSWWLVLWPVYLSCGIPMYRELCKRRKV